MVRYEQYHGSAMKCDVNTATNVHRPLKVHYFYANVKSLLIHLCVVATFLDGIMVTRLSYVIQFNSLTINIFSFRLFLTS